MKLDTRKATKAKPVSVTLSQKNVNGLNKISLKTGASRSWLIDQAIEAYYKFDKK